MSSELFENKGEEFCTTVDELKRKIKVNLSGSKGEQRKSILRELNRGIEDASVLLHEMEGELKKAPPSFRLQMAAQVRNCKRDLEDVERDVRKASSLSAGRPNFSFSPEDDFERTENMQRAQLMQGNQSLHRATESIARSHQIAAETDNIGTDIIDELGTQRESLVRTRDRLQETNQDLSRSRRILNTMGKRIITNKLILAVIIILELCVLAGVVYWKFFSKKKSS